MAAFSNLIGEICQNRGGMGQLQAAMESAMQRILTCLPLRRLRIQAPPLPVAGQP